MSQVQSPPGWRPTCFGAVAADLSQYVYIWPRLGLIGRYVPRKAAAIHCETLPTRRGGREDLEDTSNLSADGLILDRRLQDLHTYW